ncbi:MAG TPA: hypothetical protein VFW33_13690 [Gemmataceae bacterium]|nr:hypothetical protein [Gemmataceae bacterium]
MSPALLALVLASGVSAPAPAEEAIKPPQGMPPAQVIASVTKDGEFEITQSVVVPEVVTEEVPISVEGKTVTRQVQVTRFKPVQRVHRIKPQGVKVYTAAGKEVDPKDAGEKLKKPTIVLFAADGNRVDPFYLKIIKPDTLVIVAPAPTPAAAPAPVERKEQ